MRTLTKQSQLPRYQIFADYENGLYTLVVHENLLRITEVWEIDERGNSLFIGNKPYVPHASETVLEEGGFVDYVELAVIQEVYSILDPTNDLVYEESKQ